MDRIALARESRIQAPVLLKNIIDLKRLFETNLFCCFEGDDYKYYSIRISAHTGYPQEHITPMPCGGKAEVLRLQRLVANAGLTAQILFFTDRDFDKPLNEVLSNIVFETKCYSIENYYTSAEVFACILKGEFLYNELHNEYSELIELYKARQIEFHQQMLLFNAWAACQHDLYNDGGNVKLKLSEFNFNRIIKLVTLDTVQCEYDVQQLGQMFPGSLPVPDDALKGKLEEFAICDKVNVFRGKLEVYFLYLFLTSLLEAIKNNRFKRQAGTQINISKKNIISELSQYAFTPVELVKYLNQWYRLKRLDLLAA